jgi:uncharacterized protein YndB with AHSA1/START domain
MNAIAMTENYGELIEPTTLKIERLLPGPVERVWAYLTESERRSRWLAAGEMELKLGAEFELIWRNDTMGAVPTADRPAGFSEEMRMKSRITELDPPHKISFTWVNSGDVTITLTPKGQSVLLTAVHRRLPDRDTLVMVASGWHEHLDFLAAVAADQPLPDSFWSGWIRLKAEYDRRLPA